MTRVSAVLAAIASLWGTAAVGQPARVADFDWNALPSLSVRPGPFDGSGARAELQRIIRSRECDLPGSTIDNFNIDARYALLVDRNGAVLEIRVLRHGCRPLEALVAAMAREQAASGTIRSRGGPQPSWFASRVRFVS